jgi:hypothetical protein
MLREEHRLRVFEGRVLKRLLGCKRNLQEDNYIIRSFINCTLHQILLG